MKVLFSWLTILMLLLGWLTHWLVAVKKARVGAAAANQPQPDLLDYWIGDRYTTMLSVISLVVFYFVMPYVANQWEAVATIVGSTAEDPMNPLASYLGGLASPYLADLGGRRLAAMVGPAKPSE